MSSSADSLNRLGAQLRLQGDNEGAKLHYLAALQVDPGFYPALANLASVLSDENKLTAAATLVTRLVAVVPNDGIQWGNLGNFLTRLERYEEAEVALNRAAELVPDHVATWHNLLLLAHRTGRQDLALDYVAKIEALGGANSQVQNDRAHVLLAMGRLDEALVHYEARWHSLMHLEPWDFHILEWTGQDLSGKSILVHHEQGFGDTIMTSRFALRLLDRGAKVTLGLPGALLRLYEHQNWGMEFLDITKLDEAKAKEFDFHSPLYSAMRWLGVNKEIISPAPYLSPPEITGPGVIKGAFNVGICWASGKRGSNLDWRRRVSSLQDWVPLMDIPGIHFWSLNKNVGAQEEIQDLGLSALIGDHTARFEDFADTAAFIARLDLVISVDTAVAHLAGALGKPIWMLNQYTPCWRWWNSEVGSGRPWYDLMLIVNQYSPGDWKAQINACKSLLLGMMKSKRSLAA